MLKLTQCLIVKNEERNLPRAVGWGNGIVDELIVVDTGSRDKTVPLAKELGAKVLHFKWRDDFSAARNFAISQCTGDWIVFLDADEYFEEKDALLVRPFIEKADGSFATKGGEERRCNVIELPWVNNGVPSRQVRIFKNEPHLRYAGAVHEQLEAVHGGYIEVYRAEQAPAICHTGYDWSEDNKKEAKALRNFEIAEKALKKSPGCAKMQLFAAEALMDAGKYGQAESYFSKAVKNGDGSIWPERLREGYKQRLSNFLHLLSTAADIRGLLDLAARCYSEAVSKYPDDPDFDVLMSLVCFKAKDVMSAIRFFDASLSKNGGRISESLPELNGETYKKLREASEALKKSRLI